LQKIRIKPLGTQQLQEVVVRKNERQLTTTFKKDAGHVEIMLDTPVLLSAGERLSIALK
jgi:hypothetical protein